MTFLRDLSARAGVQNRQDDGNWSVKQTTGRQSIVENQTWTAGIESNAVRCFP